MAVVVKKEGSYLEEVYTIFYTPCMGMAFTELVRVLLCRILHL